MAAKMINERVDQSNCTIRNAKVGGGTAQLFNKLNSLHFACFNSKLPYPAISSN